MKITIKHFATLLFVVTTFGTAALAQIRDTIDAANFDSNKLLKQGTVVAERTFNKFAGTWVYEDSQNKLTILLEKKTIEFGSQAILFETLLGSYTWTKNGKEVVNTESTKPIYAKSNKNNQNEITLAITDSKTYKGTLFTAKLIDKNTLILNPSSERGEGIKKDPKLDFFNNSKFKRQ